MKKYIISSFVAIALVLSVVTPARAATIAELQTMMKMLLRQVAELQAQINEQMPDSSSSTGPRVGGGSGSSSANKGITVNLVLGSRGDDVVRLQNFLISKGFLVIPTGTAKGYFGPSTKAAVIKYQVANNLSENVGYVGPITRAKINAELNPGGTTSSSITIISPNGGEVLKEGDQYTIRWESKNIPTDAKIIIDIFNGGTNISVPNTQIAVLPYNATSYSWKVQGNTGGWGLGSNSFSQKLAKAVGIKVANASSDKYVIGVRAFNSGGQVTYDTTNDYFTITTNETNPTAFLNINRVKYNESTGMLDVTWKSSGIPSDKVVNINLIRKDSPETFEVNLTQGYCAAQGGCIPVSAGKASFKLSEYKTISGKSFKGEYVVRLNCWNKNSEMGDCPTKGFDTDTIEISNVATNTSSVESYISSESRLGSGEDITLRAGAYETVYGIKYGVVGNPVTVERVDVDLISQKSERYAGNYINSIQLLDSNHVTIATLNGSDGDSDDDTTSYRFTGMKYRLENGAGLYVRLNVKSTLPDVATFDVIIPKDGVRFLDGAVSETYGLGKIVKEITFGQNSAGNTSTSIPFNSADFQRVEISLPNGTKRVIYEKTGTNPAPRILSLSKTAVAAGETITIETQNVGVTADTTVYIDTFKGNRYESKVRAVNAGTGFNQKLTVSVSPSLANGQYYVYLGTENGTSNYKGLTVQSGQGANAYDAIQELLGKISEALKNQ